MAEKKSDKSIFSDDKSLGQACPDLSTLEALNGEKFGEREAGKPHVVFFWAKYAKGDYRNFYFVSLFQKQHPELYVTAINCAPDTKEDALKLMKKSGTPMMEQNIPSFEMDYACFRDPDSAVNKAFLAVTPVSTVGPGAIYLISAEGKIVWRESLSSTYSLGDSQFVEQCTLLLDGKPLIDNGKAPEDDCEEEEDDAGGGQAPDFSAFDDDGDGGY